MRVLHVIHSMDPRSGGPTAAIRGLIPHQIESGHGVTVLTTSIQSAKPWLGRRQYAAALHSDPVLVSAHLHVLSAWGRHRVSSQFGFSPSCRNWLRRKLSAPCSRPDIVHIHGVFSHITTAAAAASRACGVPYIIRPAGSLDRDCYHTGSYGLKALYTRFFLRKDLRYAAWVQATSPSEAGELRDWLPGHRIRVIPHGASIPSEDAAKLRRRFLAEYPQLQNRRVILCLSRMHAIKRAELLIEALALLRPRIPRLVLVLAGHDAGHQAALDSLARQLGLGDTVLFTGFLEGLSKAGALASADVFALPSRHENYGMSVVEAMAHAVPVLVTSGVASHVYVDAARAGLTVAANVKSIAGGMGDLLRADRDVLGRRGREYVRDHLAWPRIAGRVEHLYQSAIAGSCSESAVS